MLKISRESEINLVNVLIDNDIIAVTYTHVPPPTTPFV